jgi:hypothetical protein
MVDAGTVKAGHRKQVEFQRGDHAEVALVAAQRPEQFGFGRRVDMPQFGVRGHHLEERTWSAA